MKRPDDVINILENCTQSDEPYWVNGCIRTSLNYIECLENRVTELESLITKNLRDIIYSLDSVEQGVMGVPTVNYLRGVRFKLEEELKLLKKEGE